MKLHQYEKAGCTILVPLARNEVYSEINMGGPTQGQELAELEAATINVIEELISLVEAIRERAQLRDADRGQPTRRKEKA